MKGTTIYTKRDDVALLSIDNPPVNPLSSGVRQGLWDGMIKALNDDSIIAIVLTGVGRTFISGADISEFGKALTGPGLGACIAQLENSHKPVVVALNGVALGGGLEVALGCDFRIASPKVRVGFPEVKLGLLPGAGGTQRSPRLMGAKKALELILSGDQINANKALDLGLVDAVVDADKLLEHAINTARAKAKSKELRKIRELSVPVATGADNAEIFASARRNAARRMRGQFAPEMIVQCVEAAVNLNDFDASLKLEGELFAKCLRNTQRKALIHVFFAERQTSKIPDIPKDTKTRHIQQAGIVGCGTMGGGISMCFANSGIPVCVLEKDAEALQRGLGVIRKNYQNQVDRKRLSEQQMQARIQLITGVTEYKELGAANPDIVIEAIYENLEVKIDTFKKLDANVKPGTLLMSNTSGLDVDQIAEATSAPENVAGMHFFSPANIMRLLEVVRSKHSSNETIATAMALGRILSKIPVLSGNCPGFIGNRMLYGYTRQAGEMVLQGALPYQIDRVMSDFGMPMGPFQMADLVGLDLGWRARKLAKVKPEDKPISSIIPDKLCELGHFGQKNGKGYYIYQEGSRAGVPDKEVVTIIEQTSAELGITRREFNDEEILKRCLYPLINEGANILEENIALRPSDIDIVYINGYGFPAYKGGPLFYAEEIGLPEIANDIQQFNAEFDRFPELSPLIARLVKEEKGFGDLNN